MNVKLPKEIALIFGTDEVHQEHIGMSKSEVYYLRDMVLKIEPVHEESNNEHQMMNWLQDKLPVPRVLASISEDGINYLLTTRLNGRMAMDPYYLNHPYKLIDGLVSGLKQLWGVDVQSCPYANDLDNKLRLCRHIVDHHLIEEELLEEDTFGEGGFADPETLLQWLIDNRPEEDLVFSHGDYCLPNVFLENGEVKGFVDLGRAGIADRWQDIALCVRSLEYNLGTAYRPDHLEYFFAQLGFKPDWEKIRYYRLLDELF